MKKLMLTFGLIAALAFSVQARDELFVDAVFVKLSCYTPYQIPVPWFYYEEESSLWGEYSVWGVDVGVPWSASKDVIGFGTGIYLDYSGCMGGVSLAIVDCAARLYGVQIGIYNYAEMAGGLQIGIVNDCETAHGLQIGLVNVIRQSPLTWFPILNAHF